LTDWLNVAATGLWTIGLSILLAAFSYHDWLARETGRRRRDLFRRRSFQLPWTSGICLTSAGWGLGQASWWWEKAFLFLLAAWFVWELLRQMSTFNRKSTINGKSGTD
jgi:hypothetical protein